MKLINFRPQDEQLSFGIEADGQVWDFHDALDLEGVSQNIIERSVSLSWRPSHYGELPFPIQSVEIVFEGVDYFEVTPRDSEIPDFGEDTCINGLSRVPLEEDTRELIAHGVPQLDPEEQRFHLWFEFRGGQHIRIGAETATFQIRHIDEAV